MSDYVKQKVLRVPAEKYGFTGDDFWGLEFKRPELFSYGKEKKFQTAPTSEKFIDYVLEYEYGAASTDYGKTRALTDREKEKYLPVFQQVIPDINMDDVRLVEFCWYNGYEAPDYYDDEYDSFYDEV
ncbi:MAG: hypothetical protein IKB62_01180 [Oscillospiraceae bacterium]|nr:hypothetical protein [Oscillospiraceae bacterium]